jgi:hypothetical protein
LSGSKASAKKNATTKTAKQPRKSRASSIESGSSSLSDPDDELTNAAQGGDGSAHEDNPDDEETLDVAGMTDKEAKKLLDDEVWPFIHSSLYLIYCGLI